MEQIEDLYEKTTQEKIEAVEWGGDQDEDKEVGLPQDLVREILKYVSASDLHRFASTSKFVKEVVDRRCWIQRGDRYFRKTIFSWDGKLLLILCDKQIYVRRVFDGKLVNRLNFENEYGASGYVMDGQIASHPNKNEFAFTSNGRLVVWNLDDDTKSLSIEKASIREYSVEDETIGKIQNVTYDPKGNLVYTQLDRKYEDESGWTCKENIFIGEKEFKILHTLDYKGDNNDILHITSILFGNFGIFAIAYNNGIVELYKLHTNTNTNTNTNTTSCKRVCVFDKFSFSGAWDDGAVTSMSFSKASDDSTKQYFAFGVSTLEICVQIFVIEEKGEGKGQIKCVKKISFPKGSLADPFVVFSPQSNKFVVRTGTNNYNTDKSFKIYTYDEKTDTFTPGFAMIDNEPKSNTSRIMSMSPDGTQLAIFRRNTFEESKDDSANFIYNVYIYNI